MNLTHGVFASFLAVALAAGGLGLVRDAAAAKVSFAEAWRLCKAELDRDHVPATEGNNERYLRGGACMAKYGYKL